MTGAGILLDTAGSHHTLTSERNSSKKENKKQHKQKFAYGVHAAWCYGQVGGQPLIQDPLLQGPCDPWHAYKTWLVDG